MVNKNAVKIVAIVLIFITMVTHLIFEGTANLIEIIGFISIYKLAKYID